MKKNSFLIGVICFLTQIGFSQKEYSISGQVFSAISGSPLSDYYYDEYVRVRLKEDSTKWVFIDPDGFFEFKNLKKGSYRIVVELPGDAYPNTWYVRDDTLLTIGNRSLKNVKIMAKCPFCESLNFTKEDAYNDIKKGVPQLLLFNGINAQIGPSPEALEEELKSEKKYGFRYYEFGCTPISYESMEAYSRVNFKYLDKKYGKIWRKEVRDDVRCLETIK